MKLKFTPGPWLWERYQDTVVLHDKHHTPVMKCTPYGPHGAIALFRNPDPGGFPYIDPTTISLKEHPDAKLIAAAPKMYEALKEIAHHPLFETLSKFDTLKYIQDIAVAALKDVEEPK